MASLSVRSLILLNILSVALFVDKINIANCAPHAADGDFDEYNGNMHLLRSINPLRPTYQKGVVIESSSGLVQYLTDSIKILDHEDTQIFTSKAQSDKHMEDKRAHYNYIYKRIRDLARINNIDEYMPWFYPLNNRLSYVKHALNNTIYYHVECPNFSVKIDVIFSGKNHPIHTVRSKCEYFRWVVKKALGIFNEDKMFKFIEIPSEAMDNNIFVRYDGQKALLDSVLNFAFVNASHNLFYYKNRQFRCDELASDNDSISVAHLSASSIHINEKPKYCITDVPYGRNILTQKFNCSHDLFFVLAHELAHYFISECHIDIPLLRTFSMERKLDPLSLSLMKKTWEQTNTQLYCNGTIYNPSNTAGKKNTLYRMFFNTRLNKVVFKLIENESKKYKLKNLIEYYYDRELAQIKLCKSKCTNFTDFQIVYVDRKKITVKIPIL